MVGGLDIGGVKRNLPSQQQGGEGSCIDTSG